MKPVKKSAGTAIPMLIVFISTLIFSCASSSKQVQKPQQKEEGNRLSDPDRSYAIVSQGVKSLFPELQEKLTKNASIYTQRDTVSIKMYINPAGSIDLIGFVDKVTTGPGNILQNFMFRQIIDSTLKTETVTKAVVHSYKDANATVVLDDKIDVSYIEVRSRDRILIVINFNKDVLGKVYSKRWAENQSLEGTITVRFGIDEHGAVVFCTVVKSTMEDPVMETSVVDIVKKWQFGPINNPGDVTEVVYPFVFSQE
jgi:TonB family protein